MICTLTLPDGPRVPRPRPVPHPEHHKWSSPKLQRGERAICAYCGCVKRRRVDYAIRYQVPGQGPWVADRPACARQ